MKRNDIISYGIFGIIIIINIVLTMVYELPFFDLAVSITGIAYIVVLAERRMINFYIGFLNVILYVILCFQTALYGEAILYLGIDLPLSIVAFISWHKVKKKNANSDSDDHGDVPAEKLKPIWYLALPVAIAVFSYAYGLFLQVIGGEYVFIDSLSTGVTVVATILMVKRYREQWFMWMMVYIISIVLWVSAENPQMIVMSVGCLLFSVKGFIEWWKNSQKIKECASEENDDRKLNSDTDGSTESNIGGNSVSNNETQDVKKRKAGTAKSGIGKTTVRKNQKEKLSKTSGVKK